MAAISSRHMRGSILVRVARVWGYDKGLEEATSRNLWPTPVPGRESSERVCLTNYVLSLV
jgi:hypothetical protein